MRRLFFFLGGAGKVGIGKEEGGRRMELLTRFFISFSLSLLRWSTVFVFVWCCGLFGFFVFRFSLDGFSAHRSMRCGG